jgi:hypothetical protein
LSEGGAFQVSLSQLQVDFYPYHLASGDRSAWIRYQVRVTLPYQKKNNPPPPKNATVLLVPGWQTSMQGAPLCDIIY